MVRLFDIFKTDLVLQLEIPMSKNTMTDSNFCSGQISKWNRSWHRL